MNRLKEYLKNVDGVSHVTFDPYGPGVARVFLIPPKKPKMGIAWTIIINGESILPICMGWAILLREFINEINKYSGKSITEDDIELASKNTVKNVKEIFPKTKEEMLKKDLKDIIDVLLKISRHEEVEDIG